MPKNTLKKALIAFLNDSIPSESELDALIRIQGHPLTSRYDVDLEDIYDLADLLVLCAYTGFHATLIGILDQIPKDKITQLNDMGIYCKALKWACYYGQTKCVEALLKTEMTDQGFALSIAAGAGHTACVIALIENANRRSKPILENELILAISKVTGYFINNEEVLQILNCYAQIHYPNSVSKNKPRFKFWN